MNVWHIVILQGGFLGVSYGAMLVMFIDMCIRKEKSWIIKVIKNACYKA